MWRRRFQDLFCDNFQQRAGPAGGEIAMEKPERAEKKNKFLFRAALALVDLALINLGYLLAFWLKFGWDIPEENFAAYLSTWPWLTLAALAGLLFLWTEFFKLEAGR